MLAEPYVDTNVAPARPSNREKMIDYTNLYIKNLDPQVSSKDLFQRFKDFGKIISARVMKDTQTGVSKGFGFVSFTTMDEANLAMQRMQGLKIYQKAIAITFHEPKKTVQRRGNNMEYVPQQQQFQQQPYPYIYSANQSPPPPVYGNVYPHPRFVPDQTMSFKQPINDANGWVPPSGQVKNIVSSVTPPPPYAYSPMHHTTHTATTNNAFESNHFVVSPLPSTLNALVSQPPGYSHHLQRTTSNDSNPASNYFQRQKLREAISTHLSGSTNDLEDLVDMIQSLKKRDLSLCLFNPTFLKQKITEAYRALYVFDDDNEDDERRKSVSVATTPSLVHRHLDDEKSGNEDDENSIASLLASLEGKPLNKKKKILGDVLFPQVKATGVRRAPKVTIWLLDSVPLDELAFVMYDHHELSRMAHYASSQVQ